MNVTLYIKGKGNIESQTKNFKINKCRDYNYFQKALRGFHELKGTVFIKYFANNMFKIAGIVEGYTIVIQGEKVNA